MSPALSDGGLAIQTVVIDPGDAVDFHMHTVASDGGWEPAQLIAHLTERHFRMAAICDHDTMASVPEAMARAEGTGLIVIPGVEVTCWWDEREWHLLVYGVDPSAPEAARFAALLARQQENLFSAAERAAVVIERQGHRLPSLPEVVGDRPMLPVHVLRAVIKDGHATDLKTAHELAKRLGESLMVNSPLEEVVLAARQAGGICAIAHPGRDDLGPVLTAEQLDRMRLTIPVDGLEAHYRSYTDDDTLRYRILAYERGMLVTSGSDSHAPNVPVNPRPYPARWVAPFIRRLGFEVTAFEGDPWVPGALDVAQAREAGAQVR